MIDHIIVAILIQLIVRFISGSWAAGTAASFAWFLSREIAQAEYRWIEQFGGGLRANMSFGINRISTGTLQMLFWAFATVMGLSMSTVFLAYTGTSIAQTFFAVAAAFAGLSLYGYTTKKDLSGFGTFLIMRSSKLLAG